MFRCWKCDGYRECPWLTPHDEANCPQCPSWGTHRCDCNKPGKFTCEGRGRTCYSESGKMFVYLFKQIIVYKQTVKRLIISLFTLKQVFIDLINNKNFFLFFSAF